MTNRNQFIREPASLAEALPPHTSCAVCGVESNGKCCQSCWSAMCRICKRVIWRDEAGVDFGRGMRHSRCESAGRAVARPEFMIKR